MDNKKALTKISVKAKTFSFFFLYIYSFSFIFDIGLPISYRLVTMYNLHPLKILGFKLRISYRLVTNFFNVYFFYSITGITQLLQFGCKGGKLTPALYSSILNFLPSKSLHCLLVLLSKKAINSYSLMPK